MNGYEPPTARATPPVLDHPDRACNGADPEIFFPHGKGHATAALAICRRCTYRQECLDWAMETGQTYGVWGGTTAEQRAGMRKETK